MPCPLANPLPGWGRGVGGGGDGHFSEDVGRAMLYSLKSTASPIDLAFVEIQTPKHRSSLYYRYLKIIRIKAFSRILSVGLLVTLTAGRNYPFWQCLWLRKM